MDEPVALPERRVRVLGIVVETLRYCVRNARRLFVVAWLPCALLALSNLSLDWLTSLESPIRLPDWARSDQFGPSIWLSVIPYALWSAMVWAFVLDEMRHPNSNRGTIATPWSHLRWIRLEISLTILLAALILGIGYLIGEFARFAQLHLVVGAIVALDIRSVSGSQMNLWITLSSLPVLALAAVVSAACYAIVSQLTDTGRFDLSRLWSVFRGNWVRVAFILLLVYLALSALAGAYHTVTGWILSPIVDPLAWALMPALLEQLLNFPIHYLWLIVWPVIMGLVLNTLTGVSADNTSGTVAKASAAPLPRPGDSRPSSG